MLVVEDDDDLRELLREMLERAGLHVVEARDGRGATRALYTDAPALVVLDLMLPGVDGWEALARIRDASDVPVLVLSARTAEVEKVRALRSGADDYVTKPFGRHELVARIEALLRRAAARDEQQQLYSDEALVVDLTRPHVVAAGRAVALTPLEYRILRALVVEAGRPLSHDELLEQVWGTTRGVSPDQVRLYVNYVRRKLGQPAAASIQTVRGFGYRYGPPTAV